MLKEGKLYVNENGRMAIDERTEFHCGDPISVCVMGVWLDTRIEMTFDTDEWYAVGLRGMSLVGVLARCKI